MLHSPDFIVFLAALGLAAATPGPGLAAVVATTFEGGAVRAFWFYPQSFAFTCFLPSGHALFFRATNRPGG